MDRESLLTVLEYVDAACNGVHQFRSDVFSLSHKEKKLLDKLKECGHLSDSAYSEYLKADTETLLRHAGAEKLIMDALGKIQKDTVSALEEYKRKE